MTEQEWRIDISQTLGRIDSKLDNVCVRMDKVETAVFGENQKNGLIHDVQELQSNHTTLGRLTLALTAIAGTVGAYFGYTKWVK